MATKKPSTGTASMLGQVAKAQMGPGNSLKNFKINTGGLFDIMRKQQSNMEQAKAQSDAQLGFMPDVTKVNENEAVVLQDYFMERKQELFEIDQALAQINDPVERANLQQQKSIIENSAKGANNFLNDKVELQKEWRENKKNISNSMDPEKFKRIDAILEKGDFTMEFNDYSGKPVYVLSDGTKVPHEELDDFYYKDSKTALQIVEQSENFHNKGLKGEDLTEQQKQFYRTKLENSIKDEGSINSLLTDDLIEGMNFQNAVAGLGPNATFEEKKTAVINEIMQRQQDVYNQGKSVYIKKQKPTGTEETESEYASKWGRPFINVGTKSNPERLEKRTDKDGKTYYIKVVDGVEDEKVKFYEVEDLDAYAG